MKKTVFLLLFLLGNIVITYSQTQNSIDSSEVEKDLQKVADFMCKLKELTNDKIEENKDKIQEVFQNIQKLSEEMEKKYKNMKDDKELGKKLQAVMEKKLKECGLDEEGMQDMMIKIMRAGIELN